MKQQDFTDGSPGFLVSIDNGGIAFVPAPLPPMLAVGDDIQERHADALLALGGVREVIPFLPNPGLVTTPFLRREAILSSRIEGTYVEMDQLYLFEVEHPSRPRKGPVSEEIQDIEEVLNYVNALSYGLECLKELPICNRMLKGVHERLLHGVRGKNKMPGEFRRSQNFIGRGRDIRKARFVPPPVENVEPCMHNLEVYINSTNGSYPLLVRLALIHYQFEAIHPFADGNGRVGRLLISLWLAARGILPEPLLYLSAFFERNRDEYVRLLWEVSCRGAWTQWILFFLEGVKVEAEDACRRARQLLTLREEYRNTMQRQRGSGSLLRLVDRLFEMPAITVRGAREVLDMTYNGARGNLERLVEHGVLDVSTHGKRNRVYVAHGILDVLDSDTA